MNSRALGESLSRSPYSNFSRVSTTLRKFPLFKKNPKSFRDVFSKLSLQVKESFFNNRLTNDCLNREEKSVLLEVLAQLRALILLNTKLD
jgi:hypothetical protein